jgi:hypothetical protein
VVEHRDVLGHVPGAALIRLTEEPDDDAAPVTEPAAASEPA